MSPPLTLASCVVAASRQVHREVAGETMILGLARSRYYSLNETGGRIWTLLQNPVAVGTIRKILLDEHEVASDRVETDLLALLTQLLDEGLIELSDQSAS